MKWKALVASRMFWAAVVGLGMVLLRSAVPGFPLDGEALTQVLYLVAAYIFGEAVEGTPGANPAAIWTSRKFWASLVGALFVALQALFPGLALEEAVVEQVVWVLVTFIAGVGLADRVQKDDRAAQEMIRSGGGGA